MSIKLCSRCYFAVQLKRNICDICGNQSFITPQIEAPPLEESSGAYQLAKAVGQTWRELKADVVAAWQKTIHAAREIISLVCNGEVEGGSR